MRLDTPKPENSALQTAISYRSDELEIELEPMEIDERSRSVLLELRVASEVVWQSTRWMGKAWFAYADLDNFEQALRSGRDATLTQLGDYPTLRVAVAGEHARPLINPDSARRPPGAGLTIEIEAEPSLLAGLAQAFRAYPKWW